MITKERLESMGPTPVRGHSPGEPLHPSLSKNITFQSPFTLFIASIGSTNTSVHLAY